MVILVKKHIIFHFKVLHINLQLHCHIECIGLLDIIVKQENCLQAFKLPEPVLGIGGILQVELLGRVQRQEMDELYYIWSVSNNSQSLSLPAHRWCFEFNTCFFQESKQNLKSV